MAAMQRFGHCHWHMAVMAERHDVCAMAPDTADGTWWYPLRGATNYCAGCAFSLPALSAAASDSEPFVVPTFDCEGTNYAGD
jgi:hypothetical protein